jgi:hypothetical protein
MPPTVHGRYVDSYDLETAVKVDIENMVSLLSPFDAPFLGTFNGLANEGVEVRSILPTGTVYQRRYDWLEDELLTPRSTLGASYTSGGATFTVATGTAIRFAKDDLLRVQTAAGAELQFRVTAVNTTTDVIDVTLWSGTAANLASGAVVAAVGTLPVEGANPGDTRMVDRARPYNVTQIFGPYPIEMSETEQVIEKYGVPSEWTFQVAKRVKEAAISMEQAIIYGVRKDEPSTRRRSMGGINYYIDAANGSTVDSTTTTLAGDTGQAALTALQQGCYNKGGDPRLVVLGPANKPLVSAWRKTDINLERKDRRRGEVVTSFETDFNVVDVLMHRWVARSDLFLFNPGQTEVSTLTGRGMKWVPTAKVGDRDQSYVISEKGFKFRGAQHAAKMNRLAPS